MFGLKLKRVLKSGFLNFWRNGFVSTSAIVVMIITLFVIGGMVLMHSVFNYSLNEVRQKVDVSVYFVTTTKEDDILAMKKVIEKLPEVDYVEYLSRDEVLKNFKENHKDDQLSLSGLAELGDNPFRAVLRIKAKEPSQYESIAKYLKDADTSGSTKGIIDKVDYFKNKQIIDRLIKVTDFIKQSGLYIMILFIIISIIITFNTIRLAIFVSKDEIGVMRLVGASSRYIKGPFVITGVIYGLISAFIVLLAYWPITYWLGQLTNRFFVGLDVFDFFMGNLWQIALVLIGSGMMLGAVSSYLAVRRYIKF